jgi:hypothetical protein
MTDATSRVRAEGCLLLDAQGRQIILRGVNLGGDSKVPWPHGGTHHPHDFSDHRTVSFIGRPFPLDEAAQHLGRLRRWGFNCLRLLTTWEAIENAGPGQYDTEYLDYLTEIVRLAGEHGLYVFIDFHQDVWSRMSGGDGAPGWTFEAVGLDFRKFAQADAAIIMQAAFDYADPNPHQDGYPQMIWSSNYLAPANGIMWTLFWGGRRVTPNFRIDGVNVQDFLQSLLLGAMSQVARRLRDLPNVLGFDSLNEPGTGWLQMPLSRRRMTTGDPGLQPIKPGPVWSPLDGLAAAQGLPVTVPVLARDEAGRMQACGERVFNPDRVRIWRNDVECPFAREKIYAIAGDTVTPLREDAFMVASGRDIDVDEDAFGPWFHAVAQTTRRHRTDWLLFAELDPFALSTGRRFPREVPAGLINASHWYDIAILYSKRFAPEQSVDPLSGQADGDIGGLAARYKRDIEQYAQASSTIGAGVPTLIGEFGVPFDLDRCRAYHAWADGQRENVWAEQSLALSLMYDALDAVQAHSTLWNYTATNRNDPRIGDGWNQEDLSIFSIDQIDDLADPDAGGRGIDGFCRPYVRCAQGRLVDMACNTQAREFTATIDADAGLSAPTEIYLPVRWFPHGFDLHVDGRRCTDVDVVADGQIARIMHPCSGPCTISVSAAAADTTHAPVESALSSASGRRSGIA